MNAKLSGLKATLNHTGYMTTNLDRYLQSFIEYSAASQDTVLDMGAAYGVATIPVLAKGAEVVAVDIEYRHLDILKKHVPLAVQARLKTVIGGLPDIDFPENSFSAILCSRVLHFLRGEDIDVAMNKFKLWLKPKGRLYLITETPYFGVWKAIIPEYERRKASGERWPSFMADFMQYHHPDADVSVAPPMLNPLDKWQLERMCNEVGLEIVESSYIDRKLFGSLAYYDGRESAAVIAEKLY